jgi:hypothetical protein
MAKTLSMRIPDRLHAALTAHFKSEFEQEPADGLRTFLMSASTCKDGATLKLHLPPLNLATESEQPMLPLGGVKQPLD